MAGFLREPGHCAYSGRNVSGPWSVACTDMAKDFLDHFARPRDAHPGGPAPWGDMATDALTSVSLSRAVAGLRAFVPHRVPIAMPWVDEKGSDALLQTMDAMDLRPAAVLLVLFEEEGEARLILTRRSSDLELHRGQIAYPGGKVEAGESFLQAALREAHEEIGLDPTHVEVVGQLSQVVTLPRSIIQPIVVTVDEKPALTADPGEVAKIFDVPLTAFLRPEVYSAEWWPGGDHAEWMDGDERFGICFFDLDDDHVVWGATGRILRELLCAVLGLADRRTW